MKRILMLLYGVIAYCFFFGTILYAIGFVGNFIVPKTIDGDAQMPWPMALAINASLLLLFALQHSIMARPAFKRWFTQVIPEPIERSTFVLMSSLCLMLMMYMWQPMGGVIWNVETPVLKTSLMILSLIGWAMVFVSTFLINHFDLFGLRQVWLQFMGKPYQSLPFRVPFLYKHVRHPLYLGFLIAFWATPVMTIAHFVFALLTTGYILVAVQLEERDLVNHFGEKYRWYQHYAPMLIPRFRRKGGNGTSRQSKSPGYAWPKEQPSIIR